MDQNKNQQLDKMNGIVTKRLNRRLGTPTVNAQKLSPLEEGTVIKITETLIHSVIPAQAGI